MLRLSLDTLLGDIFFSLWVACLLAKNLASWALLPLRRIFDAREAPVIGWIARPALQKGRLCTGENTGLLPEYIDTVDVCVSLKTRP